MKEWVKRIFRKRPGLWEAIEQVNGDSSYSIPVVRLTMKSGSNRIQAMLISEKALKELLEDTER